MTTWLITGCSTGLGRALAERVLEAGDSVVVTARDAATVADLAETFPETAMAVALDVTSTEQVEAAVAAAMLRFGQIDVLVNNAGYGYRAAIEEGEDEAVRVLFETHVFGTVRMVKAVLPGMRERGAGAIVNISSIGARATPPGSGYYSAVKAAMEALTFSLRKEVAPLGVRAFAVEPGGFRTDFAGRSLTQAAVPIAAYADTAGRRRKEHDTVHGTQIGDPAKAAQALMEAVASPNPPSLLVLGSDANDSIRTILGDLVAELDAWDAVGRSTDFS